MAKKNPSKKKQKSPERSDDRRNDLRGQDGNNPRFDAPTPAIAKAPSDALGISSLLPAFALTIVIATWCIRMGFATTKGNEKSWPVSIFTAVNAATLTGFQESSNPNDYTPLGQVLTFVLMLVGILFSFIGGGLAVVRIARMRFRDWQVVAWSAGVTLIVAVIGGVMMLGNGRTICQGIYLAISAFGNCGLFIGHLPDANGMQTQAVLLPLAFLGGLGLPVLMELGDRIRRKAPLSIHSRTVLWWSAGAYAVITILFVMLREPGIKADFSTWQHVIAGASREAVNARSAGFPFEFASYLPPVMATAMIAVMIVGACPAGTAGGLKLTTLAVLSTGTRDLIARRPVGRPVGLALLWTVIYLGALAMTTLALLVTEPEFHLDRSLFLAASALGNVGLSHNPIEVSDPGLYVLSIAMLTGRVLPMLMLWYLVDTTPEARIA